jgi:sarcosine oxidase, subunit gamma
MSSSPLRGHALEDFMRRRDETTLQHPAVTVYVQTKLDCINLRGVAGDPRFRDAAESVLRQNLPVTPNTWTKGPQSVYWLAPDEWLVVAPAATVLFVRLGTIAETSFSTATWQSGAFVQLHLSGDAAREVLAKGCTLDLHPQSFLAGQCAQTLLAKAGILLVFEDDRPAFSLIVRRSFAEYLALWLAHAGREFGINFLVDQ